MAGGKLSWSEAKLSFSREACEVLEAAERLAAAPGARHVAYVLFCEHPVGPRIAGATCSTDVWRLQRDLRRHATLEGAKKDAAGINDDPSLFLELARAQVPPEGGAVDLSELVLALFEPELQLLPVLNPSGLTREDVREHLPKAVRATMLYKLHEAKSEAIASQPPPRQADVKQQMELLSKAMRVASTRALGLMPKEGSDESQRSPQAPEMAEMAELAPRAARRVVARDSVLVSCGIDLVERAREGRLDPVVGREGEISRVLQILARRTKNNVCLVGAPGVGKTAVAEAVAQRIAAGRVPPQLHACRELWSLDIGALLAGTGLRGDFEKRLKEVLQEIQAAKGAIILFIDELHLVLGAGRSENNNVDAANLMKPMLARGEIRCIGATTSEEYRKLILQKDAAFERRFQVVELREPTAQLATQMLETLVPLYAAHHGLNVSPSVAAAAVELAQRHIHGRSLPDKAIDVLDESCCFAAEAGATEVARAHVEEVVRRWRPPSWQRRKRTSWFPWLTWQRSRL